MHNQSTESSKASVSSVRGYYDGFAMREWARLDKPDDGAVEFALHARAFAQFLPPAPAHVLDLGGGPGRWTLWLAERGYTVTLADLSPRLIEIAWERIALAPPDVQARIEPPQVLDARDLPGFADSQFDAILCLGPFYHLTAQRDRERVGREIARVLRPGGRVFAAFMPRTIWLLASVLDRGSQAFADGTVSRIVDEGIYTDTRAGRFTNGALVSPPDIAPFFVNLGFRSLRLMASQSILTFVQQEMADLGTRDPDALSQMLDLAYRLADDPSILGMAAHLLYMGEKMP